MVHCMADSLLGEELIEMEFTTSKKISGERPVISAILYFLKTKRDIYVPYSRLLQRENA